jgi:hypothetical protein
VRIARFLLLMGSLALFPLGATPLARASWLPFSSSTPKPSKTTKKTASKPSKPGVVKNLSNGTKSLMTNTKNALTPKKTTTVKKSGSSGKKASNNPKTPDKPGFLDSMIHPEPPPPPKTIKEWMSLKQIHP